jgi:hypothetical protein
MQAAKWWVEYPEGSGHPEMIFLVEKSSSRQNNNVIPKGQ